MYEQQRKHIGCVISTESTTDTCTNVVWKKGNLFTLDCGIWVYVMCACDQCDVEWQRSKTRKKIIFFFLFVLFVQQLQAYIFIYVNSWLVSAQLSTVISSNRTPHTNMHTLTYPNTLNANTLYEFCHEHQIQGACTEIKYARMLKKHVFAVLFLP